MKKKLLVPAVAIVGALSLIVPFSANPAHSASSAPPPVDDERSVSELVRSGTLPVVDIPALVANPEAPLAASPSAAAASLPDGAPAIAQSAALPDPALGEERNWLALDDVTSQYYRKTFTLKAINDNTEVWVATETRIAPVGPNPKGSSVGTGFLEGDCRNNRTEVTTTQAAYLADQFATKMLPKESVVFSIAPDRSGAKPQVPVPPFNPVGPGQRTVVLVDNVRDSNFYDLNNTKGFSFIAGFFSSQLNTFFDRNVMTIDGFDWLHRTGATPPNDPAPGNNCISAPARPYGYEGVFAHEYQHLLHSYSDPGEVNWINEGLSDWAEVLTGYVNPAIPISEIGFESHTQCMLGFLSQQTPANPNPRAQSGPENSLTRWGDQSDAEILCDYGAALTFMMYVANRYGTAFMTLLHKTPGNGLVGLQEALDAVGDKRTKPLDLVHQWALMLAVDGLLDRGAELDGPYRKRDLKAAGLDAAINWDTPEAYSTAGAPSNGSDYVRLRNATGTYLKGSEIDSISFRGANSLPAVPLAWKSDPNPPSHPGNSALFSGAVDNRDESAITPITVPAAPDARLTFDAFWNEEDTWDYGFVQISSDGGATYKSVACTDTSSSADPEARASVVENLPGFTGYSKTWKPQTCDLTAYAGTSVLLAFRAINDGAALGNDIPDVAPGFWVDDVKVGATVVSDGSSTSIWKSVTETKPLSVAGFYVNIISVTTRNRGGERNQADGDATVSAEAVSASLGADANADPGADGNNRENRQSSRSEVKVTIKRVPLTADFSIAGKARVSKFIDRRADFVGAVITYDDPTETITQYAPYSLMINGVSQPGGGM
jgi:hypothetical protein